MGAGFEEIELIDLGEEPIEDCGFFGGDSAVGVPGEEVAELRLRGGGKGNVGQGLEFGGADVGQEVFVFESIEELLLLLKGQDLQLVEEILDEVGGGHGIGGVWVTCQYVDFSADAQASPDRTTLTPTQVQQLAAFFQVSPGAIG